MSLQVTLRQKIFFAVCVLLCFFIATVFVLLLTIDFKDTHRQPETSLMSQAKIPLSKLSAVRVFEKLSQHPKMDDKPILGHAKVTKYFNGNDIYTELSYSFNNGMKARYNLDLKRNAYQTHPGYNKIAIDDTRLPKFLFMRIVNNEVYYDFSNCCKNTPQAQDDEKFRYFDRDAIDFVVSNLVLHAVEQKNEKQLTHAKNLATWEGL